MSFINSCGKDNNKSSRFKASTDNSSQRNDNNCKKTEAGQLTTNANNDTTKTCSISEAKRADSGHVAITGMIASVSTKNKEGRHFSFQNRHVDKPWKIDRKRQPPILVLTTQEGVGSSSNKLTVATEPSTTAEKKVITVTRSYKLYHPKCGNTWIYKGKSPFFATCTWCGLKISVDKHRVDNLTGNGDARDN